MPILDATDGVDAHSLFVFLREKERKNKNNMQMAVSAAMAVSPPHGGVSI